MLAPSTALNSAPPITVRVGRSAVPYRAPPSVLSTGSGSRQNRALIGTTERREDPLAVTLCCVVPGDVGASEADQGAVACLDEEMTRPYESEQVVTASRDIAAAAVEIFELIAVT